MHWTLSNVQENIHKQTHESAEKRSQLRALDSITVSFEQKTHS